VNLLSVISSKFYIVAISVILDLRNSCVLQLWSVFMLSVTCQAAVVYYLPSWNQKIRKILHCFQSLVSQSQKHGIKKYDCFSKDFRTPKWVTLMSLPPYRFTRPHCCRYCCLRDIRNYSVGVASDDMLFVQSLWAVINCSEVKTGQKQTCVDIQIT
jgi:hypothetical protein